MKKRIFKTVNRSMVFVLALMLSLSFSATTLAATTTTESWGPATVQIDEEIEFDPTNADILIEDFTRSNKKPTQFLDLSSQDYDVEGEFKVRVYTNYYFYPNSNGEIRWSFQLEYPDDFVTQKILTVNCWDRTTDTKVTSTTFRSEKLSNGLYSGYISTGSYKTYNLDPTHHYYYELVKEADNEIADLTGTIKH